MAILYKQLTGTLRGKLGNMVIQKKFGKDVVSLRPEHYEIKSEKLKNAQKRFGIIVMFTKTLNKSKILMDSWKYSNKKPVGGYHKALSFNSKFIANEVPTKNNLITPGYNNITNSTRIYLNKPSHVFSEKSITITYNQLEKSSERIYPPYVLVCVFFLIFSDGKADRLSSMLYECPVVEETFNEEGSVSVEIVFTPEEIEFFKLYRLLRGYYAFIRHFDNKPELTESTHSHFFEVSLRDLYNQK